MRQPHSLHITAALVRNGKHTADTNEPPSADAQQLSPFFAQRMVFCKESVTRPPLGAAYCLALVMNNSVVRIQWLTHTIADLLGGAVAAQLYHVAATYFETDPSIAARKQPDVHSMHIEYLHPCELIDCIVTVTPLRVGAIASSIQLHLTQNDKLKVVALATSTNFGRPLGPSAPTAWTLHPPPAPRPDFDRVLSKQPDENWIPLAFQGEIFPMTGRMFSLNPREGHTVDGVLDAWNAYRSGERLHALHVALMTDLLPSLSDTLLRNNGLYDSHANFETARKTAIAKPGEMAVITNTMADAMKLKVFNSTAVLDMEFKRRLPMDGIRFGFQRTATKMMLEGRMGIDITICDEDMQLLCTAQQVVLVLDISRRVQKPAKNADKTKSNL